VLAAELEDGGEKAIAVAEKNVRDAHGTIRQVEDRIEALKRARAVSAAEEQRRQNEDRAARFREQCRQVREDEQAVLADARAIDEAVAALDELLPKLKESLSRYVLGMTSVTEETRHERTIADVLSHWYEGAVILRRLKGLGAAGLETVDPVYAPGSTVAASVAINLSRARMLALQVVPELRDESGHDDAAEAA
jgi:hypothetical protein